MSKCYYCPEYIGEELQNLRDHFEQSHPVLYAIADWDATASIWEE